MEATDDQLVRAFAAAARFLIDKCEHEGWHWSSNFLREYVRCATSLQFSNTRSPDILRLLMQRHPEFRHWVEIASRKNDRESGTLF